MCSLSCFPCFKFNQVECLHVKHFNKTAVIALYCIQMSFSTNLVPYPIDSKHLILIDLTIIYHLAVFLFLYVYTKLIICNFHPAIDHSNELSNNQYVRFHILDVYINYGLFWLACIPLCSSNSGHILDHLNVELLYMFGYVKGL